MKYMKEKTPIIKLSFQSRKYRMILVEILLFGSLMILTMVINALFPVVSETIRGNESWVGLYFILALWELFIFGAMFFVAGAWFTLWISERKTDYAPS